jgi:hypothetical protein
MSDIKRHHNAHGTEEGKVAMCIGIANLNVCNSQEDCYIQCTGVGGNCCILHVVTGRTEEVPFSLKAHTPCGLPVSCLMSLMLS